MSRRFFSLKSGLYAMGLGRTYQNLWWKRRVKVVDPWTDWNREQQSVFVHIPKNGGTSMYNALQMDEPPETHCPVAGYRESAPERWSDAYSFAFVRNPWDRFVSAFHYLKRKPLTDDDRLWADQALADCPNFEAFISKMMSSRQFLGGVMMWRHFAPQWWYVADEQGSLAIDHIGRFEDFERELSTVGEQLGIEANVVHKNKVARAHYSEFYTPDAVDFVGRLYSRDVDWFSYQFEK